MSAPKDRPPISSAIYLLVSRSNGHTFQVSNAGWLYPCITCGMETGEAFNTKAVCKVQEEDIRKEIDELRRQIAGLRGEIGEIKRLLR